MTTPQSVTEAPWHPSADCPCNMCRKASRASPAEVTEFRRAHQSAHRALNPVGNVHLAALAFLAAMARIHGLTFASADDIYIAGYKAKKEWLQRPLYSHECALLRRASDRVWSALQQVEQVNTSNSGSQGERDG